MGTIPHNKIYVKPPPPPIQQKAVFVHLETGDKVELPVIQKSVRALGNNRFEAQYSVDIPINMLNGGHYVPYEKFDATYGAKIVIWVNYFAAYFGGVPYMKVYHYDGQWIRLDHRVKCTRLTVTAKVVGELLSTGRRVSSTASYTTYRPIIGAKYRIMHRYNREFVLINDGYYQGGITTVTLNRGSSTWTGSVSVFNPGGPY